MMTMTDSPRIYVACLSSYNNGILHGAWIDADQDADTIREAISTILASSPMSDAEEYAIHDSEGFGSSVSEYADIDELSAIAQAIAEHGEAFTAWHANDPAYNTDPDDFQDAYVGEYADEEAYASEVANSEFGDMMDQIRGYFDYAAYARDLFMDGYWSARASNGNIYVFSDR